MHDPSAAEALVLPAVARSAQQARSHLRDVLRRWSMEHLADDAAVVLTELVTNVTLHVGKDVEVRLQRAGAGVRISVRDSDSRPLLLPVSVPHQRASLLDDDADLDAIEEMLSASATTGRGLQLVGALVSTWGVEHDERGKTVWALLGDAGGDGTVALDTAPQASSAPGGARMVRMVAMPVRLALESDLNLDTLIREFQVMEASGAVALPDAAPLVAAAREILHTYAQPRAAGRKVARDAAARGDRLVDVEVPVPDGAPAALQHLSSLLEVVDEHCRQGDLLALAAGPELQAFRAWYTEEVTRQVDGLPPRPCPFPVLPVSSSPTPPVELRAAERARLESLATAAAAAATRGEVARLLVQACVDALGADRASLGLLDAGATQVDIVATLGYPPEVSAHWRAFPVTADVPASEAIRTGLPVVLRTVAERDERFPALRSVPVLQDPSHVCVPLLRRQLPAAGVLNLSFERSRDFSARELRLLAEFAALAAPVLLADEPPR